MPPPLLCDLSRIDLDQVVYTQDQIYARLPQAFEFRQLDAIVYFDSGIGVARREIRSDEWWVRCHIPGRPIFPGILMLEAAAQLAAFMTSHPNGQQTFTAFGGVDDCKFRATVFPPALLYIICKEVERRPRRIVGDCQGLVGGNLVFQARVTGLPLSD